MYRFSFWFFSPSSFQSTWLSPAIGWINHPGGTFYWLIISQLRFHKTPSANSFPPLITHTFKIFIIKRIRLCSLNAFFFSGAYFKALPGCLLFRHSRGGTGCLTGSPPHPPPGRRCFFVSCFSAAIITDPVSLAAL